MYTHPDELDSNRRFLYTEKQDTKTKGVIEDKKSELIEGLKEDKELDSNKTE